MATRNIVPRADSEGGLGTTLKYWASAFIDAITTASITLVNSITEFSTDGTLGDNSDTAVPTEKAVKTYVDSVGVGDVFGPGSSTDNAVARFDSTTGKLLQNSGVTIDDSNNVILPADIYTTAWTDYSSSSTVVGWASFTVKEIYYKKIGKLVLVCYNIYGTSNATNASFSVPFSSADAPMLYISTGRAIDNNDWTLTLPLMSSLGNSTSTVSLGKTLAGAAWTASSVKGVRGLLFYEASS